MITLVCVLVASGLTTGFVLLLRAGCGGDTHRVSVAAAENIAGTLEDLALEWERGNPELDGQCVGVEVNPVGAVEASQNLTGDWSTVSVGPLPIAWVPDSDVWPEWVSGTEVTADYFSSEPVVLGESKSVLAVPEPTAAELGWLGGQPPSWSEVLEAAEAGSVTLAGADPRASTEGLQAMLNAVSDGAGGVDGEAMRRYGAAVDAGRWGDSARQLFSEALDSDDPLGFADVYTALDYQVEAVNASSDLDFQFVPVTPGGAELDAVYPYLVLDGAGWVSASDASIARMFGEYLQSSEALSQFEGAGISPVEPGVSSAGAITGETVREAVWQWRSMRRDLHVLMVVDRSASVGSESVEYGGESVSAGDAAIRAAVSLLYEFEDSARVGLWEFGVGAGSEDHWREVVEPAELSGDERVGLEDQLWALSQNSLYPGGSPLFDTVMDAHEFMSERAGDGGGEYAVVVLTNGGVDTVSAPTIEETAETLAERPGSVRVHTVGFGSADAGNLSAIAEATGGSYIEAAVSEDLVEVLR
ncbi:vWA domain-containing protein [Glycomyces xiaoerkulensis]|uniref:vWA domain-containing protein n=1 Tax=Glycomyces xiaoerkulensis TaxID=2038139 RepID=UPI0018E46BF6|nr:substrate-binding domain-containing protein [Glycomyces xiaoerkulensis]